MIWFLGAVIGELRFRVSWIGVVRSAPRLDLPVGLNLTVGPAQFIRSAGSQKIYFSYTTVFESEI